MSRVRFSGYAEEIQGPGGDSWRDTALGVTESVIDVSNYVGRWIHIHADGAMYYGLVPSGTTTLDVASTTGTPPDTFESNHGMRLPADTVDTFVVDEKRTTLLVRAVTGTVSAEAHVR